MSKKTPGRNRTGGDREDSRPVGGAKGTVPEIVTHELQNEASGPVGGRGSGPTGAQGITQAEIDATEFEEPQRVDKIRSRPVDEEG